MKDRIITALSQESTYRGIVAISGAFGIVIEPDKSEAIIAAVLAVIGAINVLKNK